MEATQQQEQPRVELIQRIGRGAQGEVWVARLHDPELPDVQFSGVKVQWRPLPGDPLQTEFDAIREIHGRLDPTQRIYLIRHYEFAQNVRRNRVRRNDQISYLALELAENRSLLDYLMSRRGASPERWTRFWFQQIMRGLQQIRNSEYSHLDIKCENILLDRNLGIKIGDFGFAQPYSDDIVGLFGSEFHRAPEIVMNHPDPGIFDGEKADVFAAGIVLFAIQMLRFPVDRIAFITQTEQYQQYMEGNFERIWHGQEAQVSEQFRDLFHRMISFDPETRPTIQDVLQHPWMQIADLPTPEELRKEIERVNSIREGRIDQLFDQPAQVELFANAGDVFRSDSDFKKLKTRYETFQEDLEKEERKIDKYEPCFFEWTHYKFMADGIDIMAAFKVAIDVVTLDSRLRIDFELEESEKLRAFITQNWINEIDQKEAEKNGTALPLIQGQVEIYQDREIEGQCWFIMRKSQGDIIQFNKLYDQLVPKI